MPFVGRAVDDDEVEDGVAVHLGVLLELLQHSFEAHDTSGLGITRLAQGGLQQREGELALGIGHLGEGQALAPEADHFGGDEVPGLPRFRLEIGVMSLGLLLGVERAEELFGGVRHRVGGGMGVEGE